ncbi:hypothetical protein [Schlesneria sp. DSM 10557]|uniref:hypothetical protein n=1 Tax=Schlesneria sp. DSM 10557 TaxID=3044399 RepID=UPI0035A083BD
MKRGRRLGLKNAVFDDAAELRIGWWGLIPGNRRGSAGTSQLASDIDLRSCICRSLRFCFR